MGRRARSMAFTHHCLGIAALTIKGSIRKHGWEKRVEHLLKAAEGSLSGASSALFRASFDACSINPFHLNLSASGATMHRCMTLRHHSKHSLPHPASVAEPNDTRMNICFSMCSLAPNLGQTRPVSFSGAASVAC
eukprot:948219-Pelagomonas_calceolata.AAC.1